MRILVTQKGVIVLDDLSTVTSSNKRKPRNLSLNNIRRLQLQQRHKSPSKYEKMKAKNIHYTLDSDDPNELNPVLKGAVKVTLKNTKISFPKNFLNKYETSGEEEDKSSSNVMTTSLNNLPTINSNMNSFSHNNNNSTSGSKNFPSTLYSFQDIIPSKTLTDLKLTMMKEERERNKLSKVTEEQFRTYYEPQTPINKINDVLKFPMVNPTKTSLIQYLNEKKKISPITIQNLFHSEPERINRFNKMCQILMHNREQEKLFNGAIQEKLERQLNDVKIKYQNSITGMQKDVKELENTLLAYRKTYNKMDKYKDRHNEMVTKHWEKYNLERFDKKGTGKTSIVEEDETFD